MPDSAMLEFSAMLGAHEKLIRGLMVNFIARMPKPLAALDGYAGDLQKQMIHTSIPGIDAAESDVLNQLISEFLERTIAAVRSDLLGIMQAARQRSQGRPPTGET